MLIQWIMEIYPLEINWPWTYVQVGRKYVCYWIFTFCVTSSLGPKKQGFWPRINLVKWNYQILSLYLVTVCQKVPILDFQSEFYIFYVKNHPNLSKKNFIEEYQFRHTFFVKSIFCWLQFLNHFITKMTPNFWRTVPRWRLKIW